MSEKSKRGGLITLDELNEFAVMRPEMVQSTFRAKITLEYGAFQANSTLVRLFPESEYILFLSDEKSKRLAVRPCGQYDIGSIWWSKEKNGKLTPRRVSAKYACAKIFRLMNWNVNNRYKVMAVYQEFPQFNLAVFNLDDIEVYKPAEGSNKRKRYFPIDWENSFGIPYAQYQPQYDIDIQAMHVVSNAAQDKPPVVARVPTPAEIITREYYVPDSIVEMGKVKKPDE